MTSLKNLSTNKLDILCNDAGLDMESTTLLIARFIKFDGAGWIYQVVASEDGDSNICICELSVTVDANGDFGADFAGTPLFESNDMEAIQDAWREGPVVRLGDDFDPLDLKGIPTLEDVCPIPPTEFLSIR